MEILKVDFRSDIGPKRFAESLRKTGFGVVTNHPISLDLIESTYDEWKRFFQSDEKFKYTFDKQTQAGYFPFGSENAKYTNIKDLKEFFHIHRNRPMPEFVGPSTRELFDSMFDLGKALLSWIDEQTPTQIRRNFSQPLSSMVNDSDRNLLRILHYPPLTGNEEKEAIRAAAHEDINLITLLPASTAMGLQVKDVKGNWYEVPGNFGDIVVNVGDMLQLASDGYYKSTTHRVINPPGELAKTSRYSMPLFLHPRSDVRLSSQLTAGDYLNQRLREIGLL